MARARLRDRHQENLRKKLQVLKAEQGVTVEDDDINQPSTSAHDVKHEEDHESDTAQPESADEDNENEE